MICLHCGRQFDKVSVKCPYCGEPITMANVTSDKSVKSYNPDYDAVSNVSLIVGALFPLIGLLLWKFNRFDKPLKASSYIGGALIGFIIYAIVVAIALIVKIFN